jgi:hypothetical protein
MLRTLLRVFAAFVAACFAAAVVQVFFAFTPVQIANPSEGLSLLGVTTIIPKAMLQSFLFAAPFVLVAAAIAEWQGIRDWIYYTLVGVAIAFAGFTTLHMGEGVDRTLLHDFAMRAFLAAGAAAGFVYWMAGGRDAGGHEEDETNWIPNDVRDMSAITKDLKPKPVAASLAPQALAPQPRAASTTPVQTESASQSVPSAGLTRTTPPAAPAVNVNRPQPPLPPSNPRPPTIQGQPLTTNPVNMQPQPNQSAVRPDRPESRPEPAPPVNKPSGN